MIIIFYLFLNINLFSTESVYKIYDSAIKSWLDGRVSDSIGSLEYVVYNSTDDNLTIKAGRDLVVLLNETNENSLAIAYIDKLKAIKPNDPYLEFEKSWAMFSLNKYKQSADHLDEVFSKTNDEDIIYFSRFLRSLVEMNLSGYEKAMDELQTVYKKYPSLLSPSTYLISYMYQNMGRKLAALNFIKDSLKYDSQNIQALIDLAHLYDDSSYYLPAWQSFYTLKEIDFLNPYFSKKSEKLIKKIEKKPDEIFYWTRLSWPVHNQPLKDRILSNPTKISLYSDDKNVASDLNSFYFISNVDFEIYDSVLGKVYSGKNNMQYSMEFIKSNRIFELRDNSRSKVYSTRNNFEIRLKDPNGVILIKNPSVSSNFFGVNKSDMEISSRLEVIVSTSGMKLYNHTYLEHILPSIVSVIKGPKDTYEFIKALTVITRTAILKKINFSKDNLLIDSNKEFMFKGLQYEKEEYVNAARETGKSVLVDGSGMFYNATYSLNSAGKTITGVDDNSSKPKELTPFELFRWISFDFFKKSANSIPSDQTQLSEISWMVLLKPKWIEDRLNEKYKIGNIKNIYILKRDSFGIVQSIKVEGTAANVEINGTEEIKKFLSGSTLRSNLFYIRPIMKGKFPVFFVIKGVGTGNFTGMCIYAANYLSKSMGYNHKQILKHYLPDATLKEK